jgi:FkbM family methyltransferase
MKNKLEAQKKEFLDGEITKQEYLEKMYEFHSLLFDYQQFIWGGNILKIEIEDDDIIFTCRNSQIKLICARGEIRSVPLTILNLGDYESDELNMQLQMIKDGNTVLDIGGNIGWYALHVAKTYRRSVVHSFEPLPVTFDYLKKNIHLNSIKNIVVNNIGFSDKIGEFDFFIDPLISGNASLVNVAEKKDIQVFKCKVETLDDYVDRNNLKVDFIKCDVEGAELFVFKGGINTLKKYQPIVFSEMLRKWCAKFNYHPNDIIDFFKQIDYLPYVIYDKCKLRKFDQVDDNTIETNYFFLHKKDLDLIKRFIV